MLAAETDPEKLKEMVGMMGQCAGKSAEQIREELITDGRRR